MKAKGFKVSSLLPSFAQPDGNVTAELHFLGKVYIVSSFSTSLEQQVDGDGEPQYEVRGGKLRLELPQIPDATLLEWAASRWMRKNGEVLFKNETGTPPLRIAFTDAACVELKQQTNMGKGTKTMLLITAKEVSFNSVVLESGWVD